MRFMLLVAVAVSIFSPSTAFDTGFATAKPYTTIWAVEVNGSKEEADALAAKHHFVNKGQIGRLKNVYEFTLPESVYNSQFASVDASYQQITESLKQEPNVKYVKQQVLQKMVKKSYVPPTDPDWFKQWFLSNSDAGVLQQLADPTRDLNVEPAWIQGYTGCNVVVGVVDDGVEFTHPDLSENYNTEMDFNALINGNSAFPYVINGTRDSHGTGCAGIIAMEKNNDVCGVGVAYHSSIIGILLVIEIAQTDITNARALSYENDIIDIYSNSWGPNDLGFIVEGPDILTKMALEQGAKEGRGGRGCIYVWAAGNGGAVGDTCAADGYVNSIYTIAIGSVGSNGRAAYYDERCSAKLAVAFVHNPFTFDLNVATTGGEGECVTDFDGTSAATPVVSGTIALTLEANPDLTWRDVQYLIAYTSNPDILTGDDWVTNGAGLKVSHHFGFGAIDAEAMVTRARHWTNVPDQQVSTIPILPTTEVQASSNKILNISFSGDIGYLEHVVVQVSTTFQGVDAEDYIEDDVYNNLYGDFNRDDNNYYDNVMPNRGDIQLELSSPQGTTSILLPYRTRDSWPGDYTEWPFMSVHFWGEDPTGDWTLTVRNRGSNGTLEVSNIQFTFYGTTAVPQVISRIPDQCDDACLRGCAAAGPEYCDSCRHYRNATTLECLDECPSGIEPRSGYCYNTTDSELVCIPREISNTEPGTNGTEPATNGTEPATNGTEPATNGTVPATNGTEPATNGTLNGTEPAAVTNSTKLTTDSAAHMLNGDNFLLIAIIILQTSRLVTQQ